MKKTIMYVDDEAINLRLFQIRFHDNYNIITCASGLEGLKKLKEHPDVSVIISDMKMPGINGVEFIKMVKQLNREISCFILTGYNVTPEISEALEVKLIEHCFHKPMNVSKISVALDQS